jgi:hypothetical protein
MREIQIAVTVEKGHPRPYFYEQLARAFTAAKDGDLIVTIAKADEKRSDAQNRALHRMLEPWCAEGHEIEDLKDDLLRAVFGERETVDAITGEVKKVLAEPHTSKLSKRKFSELMERAVHIAAECGVYLELPDEYRERTERKTA